MSRLLIQAVIGTLVALWLASAAMFQVKETESAIKFRLREIVRTDFEPGLHFMTPFIESVQKFDRRVLTRNYAAERAEFIGDILGFAGQSVGQLGLTLVDVRVKRIDLPEEVSESVYNRMRQNFARQASQLRAEGDEQAQRIRAEAERERTELLAGGNRDAEVIRGERDAKAAATYARAYQRYPEFYSFHRSLEAYRNSIG